MNVSDEDIEKEVSRGRQIFKELERLEQEGLKSTEEYEELAEEYLAIGMEIQVLEASKTLSDELG